MARYQYLPLSGDRQIRLIKLCTSAEAGRLACKLIHASLDEVPIFTALSYVWGDPEPRKAIYCSGLDAEIGPSLHSALTHLRRPDDETYVWADALCINQDDISERNQQVRLMGDIYATAAVTVIWLGEQSTEVNMAFSWLRRFAYAHEYLDLVLAWLNNKLAGKMEDRADMVLQVAFGKHRALAYQNIWALLNRSWFTRKWIIQELVKSSCPVLYAGKKYLPWNMLDIWLEFVQGNQLVKEDFMSMCPPRLATTGKALGLILLRASLLTRIEATDKLLLLVARTLEFACGDPRDHIFALIGIATDGNHFDIIDYRSSVEEVCRQLAYACVSDSMNLKLLWSLVCLAPLKDRVCSWVPNLKRVVEAQDGSILATRFSVQQVRDYNASGGSKLYARLDHGGKRLKIQGRILDKLQLLGSDNRELADSRVVSTLVDGNLRSFRNGIRNMMRKRYWWMKECMAIATTVGHVNGEEAFTKALLSEPLVIESRSQELEWCRAELPAYIHLHKAIACERNGWFGALLASIGLKSSHLLDNMIGEKLHRRFCGTGNGRLGWVPPGAEVEDLVCVFDGMELPYAIRPASDGRFHLVGECIIMGLMEGEAMEFPRVEDARRNNTVEVPSLLDVVHSIRHRQVTDPRNRIPSVMSLVTPAEVAGFVPDYNETWETTYERFYDLIERQALKDPTIESEDMGGKESTSTDLEN